MPVVYQPDLGGACVPNGPALTELCEIRKRNSAASGGAKGLGDMNPSFFLSPAHPGKLGFRTDLPSSGRYTPTLGQGKWGSGPSLVFVDAAKTLDNWILDPARRAFPGSYAVAASFSYGLAPVAYPEGHSREGERRLDRPIREGCVPIRRGAMIASPRSDCHQSLLNATFRHYFALSTKRCYDLKRRAGSCTRNPLSPNSGLCIPALLSITDSGRSGTCASSNTPRPRRR
jgi:hypothetical protein